MAGREPTYREFNGEDPLAFVVSANLKRRHLTDVQRAMVAKKIAMRKVGGISSMAIMPMARTHPRVPRH
jgi:hypothetical protein